MRKIFLISLGVICVVLGTLGIFLPVLPTTPFLLLASWAFVKSSDRLYHWLMNHRILGRYIKSYLLYRGVTKKHKTIAITTLWLTMALSIYLVDKLWLRVMLVLIGTAVTAHLLMLRTLTEDEIETLEKLNQERPISEKT